jgi:intracellular sulfur oxidation DsrE/DsrF family protein
MAIHEFRKLRLLGAFGLAVASALLAVPALADTPPAPAVPEGYYTFQHVVYQNDGGMPDNHAYFGRLLHHIGAHLSVTGGKVEIRVVNFAAGVTLFQMAKTDEDLRKQIDDLRAKGVRFMICRNTLNGMGLKPEDLYQVRADDVVPSGVAEIARLQGLGFVYIHP